MAMVLMEGFDHYAASLATTKAWSAAPNSMQTGRLRGQAARVVAGNTRTKNLPSNYATLFAGFAFRFSALPSGLTNIFTLRAAGTQALNVQLTTAGKLQIA